MSPSFLDKARSAAQQALDEAKKGLDSGQAKLDEMQVKRETEQLLVALGAAFYAEQRAGADRRAVDAALAALDRHVTEHGWVGFPSEALTPAGTAAAGDAASPDLPPPSGAAADVPPPSAETPPAG